MWSFEPDRALLKNTASSDPHQSQGQEPSGGNGSSRDGDEVGTHSISFPPATASLAHPVTRASDECPVTTRPLTDTAVVDGGIKHKRRGGHKERAKKSGVSGTAFGDTFCTETAFDRPHVCRVEGCGQAFNRLYSLRLHEKSHLMFPDYHKYKRDPMMGWDEDREQMEAEKRRKLMGLEMLPLLREIELERTVMTGAATGTMTEAVTGTMTGAVTGGGDKKQRQQRRKQVQALIQQEKELKKLALNHYT